MSELSGFEYFIAIAVIGLGSIFIALVIVGLILWVIGLLMDLTKARRFRKWLDSDKTGTSWKDRKW